MNIYTLEKVEKNLKWKYFFIHENVLKIDLNRGKEPIKSHISWKIGPLHIFFINSMDPANKYLQSGEVREKFKVELFFYSWKSVKIWLL